MLAAPFVLPDWDLFERYGTVGRLASLLRDAHLRRTTPP
jgi:hypothetical protein